MSSLSFPAAITNLPSGTKYLTILLITLTSLLFLLKLRLKPEELNSIFNSSTDSTLYFPWLVLIPGNIVWYPWTLIISSFVENNFVEFIISLVSLPLAGRYLERVWGRTEFLKFVFIILLSSNIIAVFINILESIVLGQGGYWMYGMSYHGMMALQVGFLVAFTQLIPEHQVQVFGGLAKVRVKSLPMLYVTISNIACILGYQSPYILIQFGFLTSWVYLRFVKLNEGSEFRGDRSETFSFAGWFPVFAQKYISIVSKIVFDFFVKINLLRAWTDIESGGAGGVSGGSYILGSSGSGSGSGAPGGTRAEAERRRAMALQALDQRMATSKPSSTPPPPSTMPLPTPSSAISIPPAPSVATSGINGGSLHASALPLVDTKNVGKDSLGLPLE